ncbi:MAG: tRNA (adenosine(37)-N6)-dimethylallyltransferase MiaA [bacterium]|nr:tRNA (adenosine(37)-N6)-dimethylallyltransferase MiaA [bacterium]
MYKLPVIIGPTAVGKTEIAIEIASKLNAEIISCDSRQIYKYMDIGTSKPTIEQQSIVKHWLVDVVEPDVSYNAWDYALEAREKIKEIRSRGKIPIVVGGSGLYLRALVEGFFAMPKPSADIKKRLQGESAQDLYEKLKQIDEVTANKLHSNDKMRIMRAIEVYETTGIKMSELKPQKVASDYKPSYICFTMERAKLYERIEKRVDKMIENGFVDEVKGLIKKYSPELTALQTIGYKELITYLKDKKSSPEVLDKAIALIKQNTRRYAKRQITWFKGVADVNWIDLSGKENKQTINFLVNSLQTTIGKDK